LFDLENLLDFDDLEETDLRELCFVVFFATPFGELTNLVAIAAEAIALANLADFLELDLLDEEDFLRELDLLDFECFLFLMLLGELLFDFSCLGFGIPIKNAIGLAKLKNCSSLAP
jgi:hypothetical protein